MKVTFEPGDIVEVEDNVDAGTFAACTVQLLDKPNPNVRWWRVKLVDCVGGRDSNSPDEGLVDEDYLQP